MTTEEIPAASGLHVPAGWAVDPDDPHMLRWWNGHGWDDRVRPRLVAAAEDQSRIFNEQTRLLVDIRNDVATMRNILLAWAILTIVGLIGYVLAVNS
jgi:hypothetical protein